MRYIREYPRVFDDPYDSAYGFDDPFDVHDVYDPEPARLGSVLDTLVDTMAPPAVKDFLSYYAEEIASSILTAHTVLSGKAGRGSVSHDEFLDQIPNKVSVAEVGEYLDKAIASTPWIFGEKKLIDISNMLAKLSNYSKKSKSYYVVKHFVWLLFNDKKIRSSTWNRATFTSPKVANRLLDGFELAAKGKTYPGSKIKSSSLRQKNLSESVMVQDEKVLKSAEKVIKDWVKKYAGDMVEVVFDAVTDMKYDDYAEYMAQDDVRWDQRKVKKEWSRINKNIGKDSRYRKADASGQSSELNSLHMEYHENAFSGGFYIAQEFVNLITLEFPGKGNPPMMEWDKWDLADKVLVIGNLIDRFEEYENSIF